jgi:uncharacterized membrane protein YgcG
MKQKDFGIVLLIGLVLSLTPLAVAQTNYKVVNGPEEFYYGHISYVDTKNEGQDPVVYRQGSAKPEAAVLNLPLGPGDTITTSDARRCEIQFDNGTIVRLDYDTELKIETILAKSLSTRQSLSNLVLNKGGIYVMYKQYNSREIFQVVTGNSSIKLKHNTVAMVGIGKDSSTDIQVKYGQAQVLYGPDPQSLKEQTVGKYEKLAISPDNKFAFQPYIEDTDFETWNMTINKDFDALHEGVSALPKPIQRLSPAVYYFAQRYGNLNGEWLYDQMYGYVWRPFINQQMYPWGWQPYIFGHWTSYGRQMYWVPDEPWGWVPYHLGVWQWDTKKGWFWIPGSAFAPAWVDWAFFQYGGMYAWRPWSMWDWMWSYDWDYMWTTYGMNGYFPYYSGYYSSYYSYFYPWPYYYGDGQGKPGLKTLDKITRDQLKKPSEPPFPVSREMKGVLKGLLASLKNGDENARASLEAIVKSAYVVKGQDLNTPGVRAKAVKLESFMKTIDALPSNAPQKMIFSLPPVTGKDSLQAATRTFNRNAAVGEVRNYGIPSSSQGGGDRPAPSRSPQRPLPEAIKSMLPGSKPGIMPQRSLPAPMRSMVPNPTTRIYDWNPDMKVARKLGVDIRYSSPTNEVYCPQLRISSGGILYENSPRASRAGGFSSGSSSGDGSMSGGSGGSSGNSVSTSGSSSSGSASGSSGSSGSAKGGVIK